MASNPIQSATRRFFQKFGVAFFWSLVFGGVLGAISYARVARSDIEPDPRWHVAARLLIERAERATLDWRIRELAGAATPSDDVVLIGIDDETDANGRAQHRPEWSVKPWSRELSGTLIAQAMKEGAKVVVFEPLLADPSANRCIDRKNATTTDDDRFAEQIAPFGDKVLLTWAASNRRAVSGDRPLTPVLLKLGEVDTPVTEFKLVATGLKYQFPTYVIPVGDSRAVWIALSSEVDPKDVATQVSLKGLPQTQPFVPDLRKYEVTEELLSERLPNLDVQGFASREVAQALSREVPYAALLTPATSLAPFTVPIDSDQIAREVPLTVAVTHEDRSSVVLATAPVVAVARAVGAKSATFDGASLQVGPLTIPVTSDGYWRLELDDDQPPANRPATVKRWLPAHRLLINHDDDALGHGVHHYDNELQGKIVVITDVRGQAAMSKTAIGELPRGAILAQSISSLLKSRGIVRVPPEYDFWMCMAFAFMGGLLAVAWSSLLRNPGWLTWVITLGGVAGLHILVARQLVIDQHRWVAVVMPLAALAGTFLSSLGYARTLEMGLRDFMLRALGAAVRSDVFSRVERDLALMHPERRALSVYFSDIEGFTANASEQTPERIVALLRSYLNAVTDKVLDTQGHVDKYLGDGVMAFWGAPVHLENDIASSCEAALSLIELFEQQRSLFAKQMPAEGLKLRAGIDSGTCVVGEMGTMHRVNYTVVGEPVSNAFRLQALAKRYGVPVLVGPDVQAHAGTVFVFRCIDVVPLGKSERRQPVYQLLARRDGPAERVALGTEWAEAWSLWLKRDFAGARAAFEFIVQKHDDAMAKRYFEQAKAFEESPPSDAWSGSLDRL